MIHIKKYIALNGTKVAKWVALDGRGKRGATITCAQVLEMFALAATIGNLGIGLLGWLLL